MSFWRTRAGRVPPCSEPRTGSKSTHQMSPRWMSGSGIGQDLEPGGHICFGELPTTVGHCPISFRHLRFKLRGQELLESGFDEIADRHGSQCRERLKVTCSMLA